MILRLGLRNWRAYENLDLELGPGATFVVASNGVGKTSLIMGVAWGIFGDASGVEAVAEIRGDSDAATVEVRASASLWCRRRGVENGQSQRKVALEVKLPDRLITSQDDMNELLVSEFGADPHVLSQLTIMIHGGAVETFQGEFDLQDHLAGVFGVTPLFEAGRAAKAVADRAAKALRKVKTTQRTEKRAKDDIVAELQSIIDKLEESNERREGLVEGIDETTKLISLGEEWDRFNSVMSDRTAKLNALAEEASAFLTDDSNHDAIIERLAQKEVELSKVLGNAEQRGAAARGKSELIRSAIGDLEGEDAVCPTCLRPLSEHDVERAEAEHSNHLRELEAEVQNADAEANEARDHLQTVRKLLERARAIPVPMEPETQLTEDQLEAAGTGLDAQKSDLQELDKEIALMAAKGSSLQEALQQQEEDEEQLRELEALYREEGIALATYEALTGSGNAITERYIEPLAKEIESRWKSMFGTGGLNLSAEGHITRRLGGRTLEFGSLSGGEKVWALLLTRLLILGSSTRAPFIWLDEPLEHLDPKLRKVVAGTLAKAASGSGLRQVIVTTYESELARQLMEDVPAASLIYVTTSN